MPKIVEAYGDENGKARGGQLGDQTGKEIRIRDWYDRDGGWAVYIECTDPLLAEAAAYNARLIAEDSSFGYNQDDRWSGYEEIIGGGSIDEAETGDFDCSSLCIAAYILAGLDMKPEGYTGNLERLFLETGKFKSYDDDAHLKSPKLAKRGGMYLMPKAHVLMMLEDGAGASEKPQESVQEPVQIDGKRVYAKGSVRVRKAPINGKTLTTLHKGESLPYIGTWHAVELNGETVYISGNTKYTEVK